MLSKIILNIRHCGLDILGQAIRPRFNSILKSNLENLITKKNRRRANGTDLNKERFTNSFSNDIFSPVADNQRIINIKEDIFPNGSTIIFLSFSHPDIRISLASSKTKTNHTWPKVLPKISTNRFTSIKSTTNNGNFANILKAKFGTANDIVCFWWRSSKIRIINISYRNIQNIPCGIGECNTETLLWNNSSKGRVFRVCSPVAIRNLSSFTGEIHIYIKDKTPTSLCPTNRCRFTFIKDFKLYCNVINFLINSFFPETVIIGGIYILGMVRWSRTFNPILMGCAANTSINCSNYAI